MVICSVCSFIIIINYICLRHDDNYTSPLKSNRICHNCEAISYIRNCTGLFLQYIKSMLCVERELILEVINIQCAIVAECCSICACANEYLITWHYKCHGLSRLCRWLPNTILAKELRNFRFTIKCWVRKKWL